MAIAFVRVGAKGSNNSTGFAPTRTSVSAGDANHICILVCGCNTGATAAAITPPATWNLIREEVFPTGDGNYILAAYWHKHLGASEPTSWSFTQSASGRSAWAGIMEFSGVDFTTPIDTSASQDSAGAASTTVTAPGIDPNYVEDMLIWAGMSLGVTSFTPEGTFTEPATNGDSAAASLVTVAEAYKLVATGAATGDIAATSANSNKWAAMLIGLKDASATPDSPAPSSHPLAGTILAAESMLGYLGNQPSDTGVIKVESSRLYYSRSLGVVGRKSE